MWAFNFFLKILVCLLCLHKLSNSPNLPPATECLHACLFHVLNVSFSTVFTCFPSVKSTSKSGKQPAKGLKNSTTLWNWRLLLFVFTWGLQKELIETERHKICQCGYKGPLYHVINPLLEWFYLTCEINLGAIIPVTFSLALPGKRKKLQFSFAYLGTTGT